MKRIFLSSFLLLSLVLGACTPFWERATTGSSGYSGYEDYDYESGITSVQDASYVGGEKSMLPSMDESYSPELEDRKVIYTSNLTIHVEDVRDSAAAITVYVEELGGNIIDSSITRGDNSYSGWMTLRVPVDQFDTAVSGLKEMAVYVESEYSNAQDVTEFYMDLETRLSNKQAEEQQYLEILDQAQNVTEILAVTQYLSNVRYEIESLQGQIKYYDSQIDYSTITVYLSEDESVSAVSETWKPLSTLREALADWVVFLQGFVNGLIYLVIFGWPLLIVIWGLRSWMKSRRKGTKK